MFKTRSDKNKSNGAWLHSGRLQDSGARGPGFDTYLCHVVSFSKIL